MKTLRIYPSSVNQRFIAEAAECLKRGGIIAYPTDTLYAIACAATNQVAIQKVCHIKGINPTKNTLSIACSDISQASQYAQIDNKAFTILKNNTPGPFTFILPAATTLPKVFKGRRTVGVRIPDNAISRSLAEELGEPLLTTSIPVEGLDDNEITLTEEIALRMEPLGIDIMIDGGEGRSIPSTIIDLTDSSSPEIIRQGTETPIL